MAGRSKHCAPGLGRRVVAALADGPGTVAELACEVEAPVSAVADALTRAARTGQAARMGRLPADGHLYTLWSLPEHAQAAGGARDSL
jgi:hypothetical protein